MRKKIAAGNWKMFKNYDEAVDVMKALCEKDVPNDVTCIIAPPYPYLNKFVGLSEKNNQIQISAQNCHEASEGAFTGEVSAPMLKSLEVPYVIIGHSERRAQHAESNETLKQKVEAALESGLLPIFCCGEALEIRKKDKHIEFVTGQISDSLGSFTEEQMLKIVVAYEPIWAIGTGETASPDQAQEMHKAIREHLANMFSKTTADEISILYGGSVNPSNAKDLFANEDVDGGLVGGASLDADSFHKIIHSF